MGDIVAFRNALYTHLAAALVTAGYPALVSGTIDIGTAAEFEQTAPPRIILDPTPGDDVVPAEYYSGSAVMHTDERAVEGAMRTPFGDNLKFMVHVWAAAGTAEPGDDYDLTRKYFQQIVASMQAISPGAFDTKISAKYRPGSNVVRLGRWLTFNLTIYTPILDSLLPYDVTTAYAAGTVAPVGTDNLLIPTTGPTTGPSEAGC